MKYITVLDWLKLVFCSVTSNLCSLWSARSASTSTVLLKLLSFPDILSDSELLLFSRSMMSDITLEITGQNTCTQSLL